ncbi:MAG: adenylyltransferase/cytidyltransferase family protein, partial [Nitrososphaeraceae archaeon]
MSRGLFIGRFQPFHLGHKASIDFALSQVESLVIVIGSSQKSYEARNPFTSGERILMIKESLNADVDLDQKRLFIIPIPDINIHSLWTAQISNSVPKF